MIPSLTTTRLVLRPAQAADLDALWTLWTDPDVRRYLWDDRVITRGEAESALADFGALHAKGLGLWVLGSRGWSRCWWRSRPAFWGRGYAHETLGVVIEYATQTLGLHRLAGVTDVPNTASNRMLRRAGFVRLGERDGPRYPLRTYLWEA